jgi:RecB family exonuclease
LTRHEEAARGLGSDLQDDWLARISALCARFCDYRWTRHARMEVHESRCDAVVVARAGTK